MIFVTIGSLLPFDRLIRAMDEWGSKNPDIEVLAQIGRGSYEPRCMRWVRTTTPVEFKTFLEDAAIIVAHAGMGTIIESAELGKHIVILPRLLSAKEHNTEHQLHTARRLIGRAGVHVAMDESELPERIEQALAARADHQAALPRTAPAEFVVRVRGFLTRDTAFGSGDQ